MSKKRVSRESLVENFRINNIWFISLSVLFFSISLFSYQVALTKVFSAILYYHYAFLVISSAIFGLGLGGIITHIFIKRVDSERRLLFILSSICAVISVSYLLITFILFNVPYTKFLIFYFIMAGIPFVLGGVYLSLLFKNSSNQNHKVYFADLIGSGVGSILIVYLLNNFGVSKTIVITSMLMIISAIILAGLTKKKSFVASLLAVFSALFVIITFNGVFTQTDNNLNSLLTNKDKIFAQVKKQIDAKIEYTKWDALSRTDVIGVDGSNEKIVTIDGAAGASMHKFNGDINTIQYLKNDLDYFPYVLGENNKVLIIGPGGGKDILYPLLAASKDISAVEINKSSIDAGMYFSEFNGNIFQRPEVTMYAKDGREFIRKSEDKYDVIFLSLVMNQSQSSAYAFSENYIYTTEAIEQYYKHLNKGGRLAFILHDEQDLTKTITTTLRVLENNGIELKDAVNYFSISSDSMEGHGQHSSKGLVRPLVIIKNEPFSQKDSLLIDQISKQSNKQIVYLPNLQVNDVFEHIREGHESLVKFISKFPYYVEPATDDSPFFFNYSKGISKVLFSAVIFILLIMMFIFIPSIVNQKAYKESAYFALIGAGFMMIEIPFIQKFTLILGHPILAFVTIVAGLLLGAGLGSLLCGIKYLYVNRINRYLPCLIAGILVLLSNYFIAVFNSYSLLTTTFQNVIITILFSLVIGLFLGMPFPYALNSINNNKNSNLVPLMWGLNGSASVVGSILAMILAMNFGISYSLYIGGIMYLVIFMLFSQKEFGRA